MDSGAQDHQKDRKKCSAPGELYSQDPFPQSCCVVSHGQGESFCFHGSQQGPGHAKRENKSQRRHMCEVEAQQLLKNQRPIQDLLGFLQQVPWHVFHSGPSHARPALHKEDPSEAHQSAYAGFGMYSQGGMRGLTNLTKECPWMTRLLNVVTWLSVIIAPNILGRQ